MTIGDQIRSQPDEELALGLSHLVFSILKKMSDSCGGPVLTEEDEENLRKDYLELIKSEVEQK